MARSVHVYNSHNYCFHLYIYIYIHAAHTPHKYSVECAGNSLTFSKMNYFESQREEHLACRQNLALFDLTAFAKLEVKVRKY